MRLGVVTTDAPLAVNGPVKLGVDEFCQICKKCYSHCPTKAISLKKIEVRGVVKWKVDGEKCIQSCVRNHECNICFHVCPWNKKPALYHRLVASLAATSGVLRRFLLFSDDLFYGK